VAKGSTFWNRAEARAREAQLPVYDLHFSVHRGMGPEKIGDFFFLRSAPRAQTSSAGSGLNEYKAQGRSEA
jgi:hypothetical protein